MSKLSMLEERICAADTCEHCEGKGVIEKTEWSGTDDSYHVTVKCVCNQE